MIIRRYQELTKYMDAFAQGHISLLIVRGGGGIGKTHNLTSSLKNEEPHFFNGHATPLSIYLKLSKKPDELAVFDDVDSLITNKVSVALLKQICEIKEGKIVRYETTHKVEGQEIPSSFESNNKVCLLCNDFKRIGRNIKALLTRGIYLDFQPSNWEVLRIVKQMSGLDEEIYNYLCKVNKDIKEMNFRIYQKCVELKDASINWRGYLHGEFNINQDKEFALQISDLPKDKRNQLWEAETGKSVRSLQRILKQKVVK